MKILMITEGCYPYVVGGVSGWVQTMIEGLKEHTFDIFTIAAETSQRGKFNYALPTNVTCVYENFLLSEKRGRTGLHHKRLPRGEAAALGKLTRFGSDIDWPQVHSILSRTGFDAQDYLSGYDFFEAAEERYLSEGQSIPFADYLWTLRSMFLPLITILAQPIPKADLYHAVSAGYAGLVGALGALLYGKPFLLTEHGIYTREREEEMIRAQWATGYFKQMWISQFYLLSKIAYDQADTVVALFDRYAAIQRELGCAAGKIRVISNGVSPTAFEGAARREPDGFINIGAVVRITPIKDIKTMIMAFHEVKQAVPNARFFILGPYDEDPDYHQECLNLIEHLGLAEVSLPGRVDIRRYVPQMDVMVLTSISEGQPLAILEGMLLHKPWVATNVGSCSQLLQGNAGDELGEAGLLTPVMDVKRIAEAIIRLAKDESLRLKMGEVGYARALRDYRQSDMFASYRALYGAPRQAYDVLSAAPIAANKREERWQASALS